MVDDRTLIRSIAEKLADGAPNLPRYRRLMVAVEAEIVGGRLRPGQMLPGERALAAELGLSRVTVRKALDALAASGLVARRHGARTEVNTRVEKPLSALMSFSEDMEARGISPGFRWISRELTRPSPDEAMALGISPAGRVWRFSRVRTGDGQPIAREVSTIPGRHLLDAELIDGSLYKTLAARGAMPSRAVERFRATGADALDRTHLECADDTPILEFERRCFLANGEPVEFTRSRYRADVYDFVIELTR